MDNNFILTNNRYIRKRKTQVLSSMLGTEEDKMKGLFCNVSL